MNRNPDFAAGARPARILIVDDGQSNRDLLYVMLQPDGFEVEMAETGEDALRQIAVHAPDLILLDIMMPGMDGNEVARILKANPDTRHIPIIMVASLDNREGRILGLRAGADDFLTKPVDRGELSVRVRNLLRLKAYGDHYDKYSQMLEREVMARTADLVERTKTLEQHATALRRSEERTNYALGTARMGIWEIDITTHELTWSETMAAMFGLTEDQSPTSAEGFIALVHPDDRRMAAQWTRGALEGIDGDRDVEFRVLWPDGTTHWHCDRSHMLRHGDGTPARLIGLSIDVGERKSLEAQLRQAQKMEAVGQLAGGVAHDFNNMLTAILGFSNFVLETMGPQDPRREDMNEVVKAGQRAATLTRQLLAFSRKQVLQPTSVDLNVLVTGMHLMLRRLIGDRIELEPVLPEHLGSVRADSGQLEQVLMNLVVNARDAMPAGGKVTIRTADIDMDQSFMADALIQPGPYVMLSVSDCGIGMSEAIRQRLFEPFFTTKEKGKGTGLGLATVYGIVKQSGGYIGVVSEPGKGTTFNVYLPRVEADSEVIEHAAVAVTRAVRHETILLVEDDDAVRSLTGTILERAGYRVYEAPDPLHAVALFERYMDTIDLLLTDVIMPGSSGTTLYARLSGLRSDLKVMYMSGYNDDTVALGQSDPGIEFLQKPFTADVLTRRVRDALDRTPLESPDITPPTELVER
ncbi:MAG: response regulator [Gemmatimonadota bacterium]